MSRCAGSVAGSARLPPVNTRMLRNAGRNRVIGSSSWNRPSSYSIMIATEVSGLVIE